MIERRITTNSGIELDVVEAGTAGNPAVVLLHGFPESSYSWRHQMQPLADAGYHVLAPNQRGYAGSSAPHEVHAYRMDHLTSDVCGVLDNVGVEQAVIVGHDWGAMVAWGMGFLHPDRCRAVVGASVPLMKAPAPPLQLLKMLHGDGFFYILYFQEPGVAEAELEADPERFLQSILWAAAGESSGKLNSEPLPFRGTTMTQAMEHAIGSRPEQTPPWLSQADLDVFVAQFRQSGFFGPLGWYRNLDANHELTKDIDIDTFSMPTGFVAGTADPVIAGREDSLEAMATTLPDFRGTQLISGAGHWVQQETPDEFNSYLLGFLDNLD